MNRRKIFVFISLLVVSLNAFIIYQFVTRPHDDKRVLSSTAGGNSNFYGINWHPMWINAGGQNTEMDLMKQVGIKAVRIDAEWYFMEQSKGSYQTTYLSRFDNAVNGLIARGIEPLIIVTSTPKWVTNPPSADPDPMHEPPVRSVIPSGCNSLQTICSIYNHVADYDNFLSFLMKRYLGKVHDYEIWNEPDGYWSWRMIDSSYPQEFIDRGTDYTTLLKSAYQTAKTIDPSSVILGGSLSNTTGNQQYMLKSMYQHGAKNYFDVYSQHYYCDPPNDNWCNSNRSINDPQTVANTYKNNMYPILQAYGDGSKPVWVTETGYNTSPSGVSESTQGTYLTQSYTIAKTLPSVTRLYWYDMDEGNTGTDPQSFYGIIVADMYNANSLPAGWRYKPAYTALQKLALTSFPTTVPTIIPTVKPTTFPTPIPTKIPTAFPTKASTHTTLQLTINLHGVGVGGDNAKPNSQENMNPLRQTRTIITDIYNSQNQLVTSRQGTISYNVQRGRFSGMLDLGTNFSTGYYTVKIKTDQYLRINIPGIQKISIGQTNTLPAVTLVAGDINGDNQINIIDFNILVGCYSDLLSATDCNPTKKVFADINDDGYVNQIDYNLFIRELTNIGGQ